MELNLNIDTLTLADVADLEEVTGRPVDAIFGDQAGEPKGRILQALVWVIKRQEDPSFTFEDAGRIRFSELKTGTEDEGDEDPT